jgi:hypothetical protein
VLALVVLAGLAIVGTQTAFSVRGGLATTADERFHTMAMYAAESGAAMAIDYLRGQLDPVNGWSALVSPANVMIQHPAFPANGALPGAAANPFSADQASWFDVEVLNNREDAGFTTGHDDDARITILSTGHAAGSVAKIEWTIAGTPGKPMTLVGWRVLL